MPGGTVPLLIEHGGNEVGKGLGVHLSVLAQLVEVVAELEAVEPSLWQVEDV
jgi:hypothetical protein